jgi:hypothetical protein
MHAKTMAFVSLVIACLLLSSAWARPGRLDRETPDVTDGTDTSWLVHVQEQVVAREYQATENGEGVLAPNRADNLRTFFESTRVRVHDRTASGSPELLRLSLVGVGSGNDLEAVEPSELPEAEQEKVRIRRPGLVERYVNSPAGLEQGFNVSERLPGPGSLVFEIAVAGGRASLRGDAISFASGARKLRYGELIASDASEVPLPADFELAGADRLRIVVDDAGATYRLVIDQLLTETADTQLESEQPSARLGISVAGAGDVNGDEFACASPVSCSRSRAVSRARAPRTSEDVRFSTSLKPGANRRSKE